MMHGTRGFTLIELLVSLAIVAVLGLMVVPVIQVSMQRQKEQQLLWALHELRNGIDAYKRAADEGVIDVPGDSNGYPPNLETLVDGVARRETVTPGKVKPGAARPSGKIYFLRRIPRDPMNDDSSLAASQTWGKRSFASEASEPKEGVDVYDVYTMSHKRALNGSWYAHW